MPTTKRDQLIRHHEHVQNDLGRAVYNLTVMRNMYREQRPDLAAYVDNVITMLTQVQEFCETFRHRYM